jgi:hypothetical protein
MAVQESGLGRYEDKLAKNRLVAEKTPGTEALIPTAWTGDDGLTLVEWAPYGVIGSITPTTNPTETILNNGIGMVAAGNAIVFNTHPSAKKVSAYFIDKLNRAVQSVGGPPTLFNCVAEPTIETAGQFMKHPGIRLIVVTGGGAVVKAAMTCGKRAIAAGPGNPPVVVDDTADIAKAARDLVFGASPGQQHHLHRRERGHRRRRHRRSSQERDEGEQSRRDHGPGPQAARESCSSPRMTTSTATTSARTPRSSCGTPASACPTTPVSGSPRSTRAIPFVQHEMLLPVLGFVRVPDADSAIACAKRCEHGYGHTAVIHSNNVNDAGQIRARDEHLASPSRTHRALRARAWVARVTRPGRLRVRPAKA